MQGCKARFFLLTQLNALRLFLNAGFQPTLQWREIETREVWLTMLPQGRLPCPLSKAFLSSSLQSQTQLEQCDQSVEVHRKTQNQDPTLIGT